MYPLPSQLPNRANDFGIDIKDEAGPSGLTAPEKGKTKVINVVSLEKTVMSEDTLVMPIGKRTTEEKEGRGVAGPSKKKGKAHEGEDVRPNTKEEHAKDFMCQTFH